MDVRLADGTVILGVPEGTSEGDIISRYASECLKGQVTVLPKQGAPLSPTGWNDFASNNTSQNSRVSIPDLTPPPAKWGDAPTPLMPAGTQSFFASPSVPLVSQPPLAQKFAGNDAVGVPLGVVDVGLDTLDDVTHPAKTAATLLDLARDTPSPLFPAAYTGQVIKLLPPDHPVRAAWDALPDPIGDVSSWLRNNNRNISGLLGLNDYADAIDKVKTAADGYREMARKVTGHTGPDWARFNGNVIGTLGLAALGDMPAAAEGLHTVLSLKSAADRLDRGSNNP
ncbi:MAG: hypothetical protein HY243_17870 [Proteobacteria bacterium]|nr:hypothetical protein [Pseudomonadota bacterium]